MTDYVDNENNKDFKVNIRANIGNRFVTILTKKKKTAPNGAVNHGDYHQHQVLAAFCFFFFCTPLQACITSAMAITP